jgi:hypothetical protein
MSALLLSLLSACAPPGPCDSAEGCDTADTSGDGWFATQAVYDGPPTLDQLFWTCTEDPSHAFSYELYTIGWTSLVTLEIAQVGGDGSWVEQHTLKPLDYDPNRWWERTRRELSVLDGTVCHREDVEGSPSEPECQSIQEADINTWFLCQPRFTDTGMAWAVTLTDLDGQDAGCWTWGADAGVFPECEPFDP